MSRRAFLRNDEAVSEIVGYILSFALSAVFLLIALTSFWTAQQNTDSVVTAAELKTLSNRISSRIVEAGLAGSEFPNATFTITIALPQAVNGHPYSVTARSQDVTLATVDGLYSATASNLNLDKTSVYVVPPSAAITSSNERVVVTYQHVPSDLLHPYQISLG